MQDTKRFEDRHPAAGLRLAGALGSLRKGGEEEQGGSEVWGAVKDGVGCKVTVDGEDFSEEVGGVDEAGKEEGRQDGRIVGWPSP